MSYIVSLLFFLGLAVWQDYQRRKISNRLIIAAFIYAVLVQLGQKGFQGIIYSIWQVLLVFAFLFPFFYYRRLGAGDIKLLCVTAVYLSWRLALLAFLAGLYFALFPVLLFLLGKKSCAEKKIPMSGPILGGILFVMYREGML